MTLPRDTSVRGGEAITALQYYAKIAPVIPETDGETCVGCGGAGYVRYERPPGHPFFGQYRPCPRCVQKPQTESEPDEKWWQK